MRRSGRVALLTVVAGLGLALGASGGSTLGQFSATTSNSGNAFSAAATFPPACTAATPYRLTGFEHGLVNTNLFNAVTGSAVIDASKRRSGVYSAKVTKASGPTASITEASEVGVQTNVVSVALLLDALPVGDVSRFLSVSGAGSALDLGYQASSQKLTLRWGTGALTTSSTTVAAGAWYPIDLRVDTSANPRTAQWRLNGVPQTSVSSAEAVGNQTSVVLGSSTTTDAFTTHYDDYMRSKTLGDYPVGPVTVRALRPNGMGVHVGATRFLNDDSTAVDALSYTRVDESPMDSSADGVIQVSASATSYVELSWADITDTCVKGVQAVVSQHKSGSPGDAMKTSVFDGTTERVVYSGDAGGTAVTQKTAVIPPASAPWTPAAVNALVVRIGYSTDVSPTPVWDSLLLEVAVL
jgi:hypothetical protein